MIRNLLLNDNPGSITWLDIGTDNTPVTGDETALTNEYGEAATESEPTTTSVSFSIDVAVGEGNGGGTVNYCEVGVLTGDGGTLFSRQVFDTITKDNTVAFVVSVTVMVNS